MSRHWVTLANVATLVTQCRDLEIMLGHYPHDVVTLVTHYRDIELVSRHSSVNVATLLLLLHIVVFAVDFCFFSLNSLKT